MHKLWQEVQKSAPSGFDAFVDSDLGLIPMVKDVPHWIGECFDCGQSHFRIATLHDAADWLRSEGIECWVEPALYYTGTRYTPCVSYIDKNPIHLKDEWRTNHPIALRLAIKKGFEVWEKLKGGK